MAFNLKNPKKELADPLSPQLRDQMTGDVRYYNDHFDRSSTRIGEIHYKVSERILSLGSSQTGDFYEVKWKATVERQVRTKPRPAEKSYDDYGVLIHTPAQETYLIRVEEEMSGKFPFAGGLSKLKKRLAATVKILAYRPQQKHPVGTSRNLTKVQEEAGDLEAVAAM